MGKVPPNVGGGGGGGGGITAYTQKYILEPLVMNSI